jgi:hypothetical protein
LAEAREQVALLRQELNADPGAGNRRQQAARERAARERQDRVRQAFDELQKIEAHRAKGGTPKRRKADPAPPPDGVAGSAEPSKAKAKRPAEPRASTTDPEARVMKGPDGGFRPSYNVQLATDVETQCVVGVAVVNEGADQGQLEPMSRQGGIAPAPWPLPPGNAGGWRIRHGGRNPGRRRVEQPRLRAR